MTRRLSRRGLLRATGTGAAAGIAGVAGCLNRGPPPAEQVADQRDALSKYTDLRRTLADGYRMSPAYVTTDEGALGVPFVDTGVEKLKEDRPQVLFYDLRDDGTYALLGAEWLVPSKSADGPPSLFGKEFHAPMAGETSLIPKHYGLHAWLFSENPDGMFDLYNGAVDPPSILPELRTAWEATREYAVGHRAEKAGYTNTEKCVGTSDGGYGVPFVDADHAGETDPSKPPVLLYRLTSNWSYRLLGAEWYVPADEAGSPPSMFGEEFHGPMDGHSPKADQPRHYGLHAWLYRANPRNLFADYNPAVRC